MKTCACILFLAAFSFLLYQYYYQEDNFSEEIIEEFRLLDNSLSNNQTLMEQYINTIVHNMENDSRTRPQYSILTIKAKELGQLTREFITNVDSLKVRIIQESGGNYSAISIPIDLEFKILEFHKNCIALIEDIWNSPIKGTIFNDPSKKTASMQELKNDLSNTLFQEYFNTSPLSLFANKSVVAILPLLQKLINDAKNVELMFVNFLQRQQNIGWNLQYNTFDVLSQSTKPSIRLGETYSADIALGIYSSNTQYTVQIDNQTIESINGKATYSTKPTSTGKQEYTAKITIKNPLTGEIETVTKIFYYEVIP